MSKVTIFLTVITNTFRNPPYSLYVSQTANDNGWRVATPNECLISIAHCIMQNRQLSPGFKTSKLSKAVAISLCDGFNLRCVAHCGRYETMTSMVRYSPGCVETPRWTSSTRRRTVSGSSSVLTRRRIVAASTPSTTAVSRSTSKNYH